MPDVTLESLRAHAKELGIEFHHRAGIDKLKKLIYDHEAQQDSAILPDPVKPKFEMPSSNVTSTEEFLKDPKHPLNMPRVIPLTEAEYQASAKKDSRNMAGLLIHCRVQCMNPNKKEWQGEILSVGSASLGTFKKWVPFHNVPWHVPKIIFDMMKERKCSSFVNNQDGNGTKTRRSIQINEFAIEVLPPLTLKELDDLRVKQAMAKGNTQ